MVRTPGRRLANLALGVLVAALLSFGPLATYAASRLPLAAERPEPLPISATRADDGGALRVRDLPVPRAAAGPIRELVDLVPLALPVLGEQGTGELLRILEAGDFEDRLVESALRDEEGVTYPYRYPPMTRLLDGAPNGGRVPQATDLGAALVMLSTRTGSHTVTNAPAAAYAVLDRARGTGDCGAQLNLLLLVAADAQPRDSAVATEADRAGEVCPGDPTPAWLEAQYLSQRATAEHDGLGDPVPDYAQPRADAMWDRLLRDHPHSVGALAGWADNRLRVALRTVHTQPFTARHAYRQAESAYRTADSLDGSDDHVPGRARSLVGLAEARRAAELVGNADRAPFPGLRLQVLLRAQEAAGNFEAASQTARRLDDAGAAAFTQDGPAYPVPGNASEGRGPIGSDRYTPLHSIDLQPSPEAGGNGAVVLDASYVPSYREEDGITGHRVDCPDWAWRRDAVLAGAAESALADPPSGTSLWFEGIRPEDACPVISSFLTVVRAEARQPQDLDAEEVSDVADSRQNLWRWAGDLRRAERVISEWSEDAAPVDPQPVQRLGEVRFLQEEYDDAARLFARAARLHRDREWNNDAEVFEALLQRGGALIRAGRDDEARPLLRSLDERAAQGAAYQRSVEQEQTSLRFAVIAYHARALLADSERDSGALEAAVEDYEAARELVPTLLEAEFTTFRPERVDNNLAVALAALDRGDEALDTAERALAADPQSPIFLLTAGMAAGRAGETSPAIDYYRKALASDPQTFPAANDLGVLLAGEGRITEAVVALRQAVGAAPGYALGWFNLGVVQSMRGPAHLPSAQGAFARAYELDPKLADREPTLTPDETTYRSGLDLSRPLPPRWSFARLQQASPTTSASLLAVLLLAVGLMRSTGRSPGSDLAAQYLTPVSERMSRLPVLAHVRRPLWGVVATVLVFTIPTIVEPVIGVTSVVAGALGVLVVSLTGLRIRGLQARRFEVRAVQESWAPGMAFGLASGAFGAPWAPLPVVRTSTTSPTILEQHETATPSTGPASTGRGAMRVHAAAPLTFGALAIVLFLEAAALHVPLTRAWGVAALIMTASTLVPVEPLDGARLTKVGLIGSVGVVAGALLVITGVI